MTKKLIAATALTATLLTGLLAGSPSPATAETMICVYGFCVHEKGGDWSLGGDRIPAPEPKDAPEETESEEPSRTECDPTRQCPTVD
jgi:hypothetical protein